MYWEQQIPGPAVGLSFDLEEKKVRTGWSEVR